MEGRDTPALLPAGDAVPVTRSENVMALVQSKGSAKPQVTSKAAPVATAKPKAAPAAAAEIKAPVFLDADGKILMEKDGEGNATKKPVKHSRKDFPKGVKGEQGFIDYMIAKLVFKKENVAKRVDPAAKAKAKAQKLRDQLARLEAEIEEQDGDATDAS